MKIKIKKVFDYLIFSIILILFLFSLFSGYKGVFMIPVKERFNLQKLTYKSTSQNNRINNPVINLFSEKESDEVGEFYWLTEEGNLLSITNQESNEVRGVLFFNFKINPCGLKQKIVVGDKYNKIILELSKNNPKEEVTINFNLQPFSTSHHFINSFEGESCQVNNGDNRNLVAQMRDFKFEIK